MAVYSQLLIDTGNGVVDHGKQSPQEEGASVIIGLGGTGTDLVMKVKKEMYKQIQPDDLSATIPKYNNIKYLVIDSDISAINAQSGMIYDVDDKTEYFDISNKTITSTFGAKEIIERRPDLDWLEYDKISIRDASTGAGGIRQVGRFLVIDQSKFLFAKLKSIFLDALSGANGNINVHIAAGISGGTGSGTFLDVCYMVRQALREIGKADSKIHGYFFLPDVNLSIPSIAADPLTSSCISANGYAALQELDYCMNFGRNKDHFYQNYGTFTIDDSNTPVDLCYLVSATDSEGKKIDKGYEYAMGVTTDYIISFLAKVKKEGEDESKVFTLQSHISNLNAHRQQIVLEHGAGVEYNMLGASVAEVPLSEIATYLGACLFEKYEDMFKRVPTEAERDAYLKKQQLVYEDIRKTLTKNCKNMVPFSDRHDAKLFKDRGNGVFVELAEKYYSDNCGALEDAAKALKEDMGKDWQTPKNSTSLIGRVFKSMCDEYASKLDYGPVYAHLMLAGGDNKNLLHSIDGMIEQNAKQLEAELRQEELRSSEYEKANQLMKGASFINQGDRIKAYKNELNNLYVHHYKVEVFKQLDDILKEFKKAVLKLDNSFFKVLGEIMFTLKETFEVNKKVLTREDKMDTVYRWKILSINEIRAGLDDEVEKIDFNQTVFDLIQRLLDSIPDWITKDENRIVGVITKFVLDEFTQATQKTIIDYLKEKYQVDDQAQLAKAIEDDIMRDRLGDKSFPLFWKNPMYHGQVDGVSYLTVPHNAKEIVEAAENYSGKFQDFEVRKSGITDKISMMRFYSGMPLYAYQGLREMEREYEADPRAGKHLFAKGSKHDWNKFLPSPIPASFKTGTSIPRLDELNARLIEEFAKAKELGVIYADDKNIYYIKRTADFNIDSYIEQHGGYTQPDGSIDRAKAQNIMDILKNQRIDIQKQTIEEIKLSGNNRVIVGQEEMVAEDFYVSSPILQEIVGVEVNKLISIDEKVAELENVITVGGQADKLFTDFTDAIFSGVINYAKTCISYSYETYSGEKTVVLQDIDMEKMGDTGAFLAYENYKALDDKLKEQIKDEAKKIIKTGDEQLNDTVESLKAKMPKRIAAVMLEYDETRPEHAEIEAFYEKFMKALKTFELKYVE